jgi:preprotein translocase subunit SecA
LQTLDAVWKEHLLALDHLRQGIGLRAYGQRDPLNEYKSEGFAMFHAMLDELKERVTGTLARVEASAEPPPPQMPAMMFENHPEAALMGGELAMAGAYGAGPEALPPLPPMDPDVLAQFPRNASCPCGSGRKFKHCHGRVG